MDDLTCVKMVLRSLLLTYKDGCRIHSLPGAYRELDGNVIPYRQLGYSSLQQFIQHIPDCARLARNRDGEEVVFGVSNDATEHIQKMVQRQKSKKSRARPGRGRGGGRGGRSFRPGAPRPPRPQFRGPGPRPHQPAYWGAPQGNRFNGPRFPAQSAPPRASAPSRPSPFSQPKVMAPRPAPVSQLPTHPPQSARASAPKPANLPPRLQSKPSQNQLVVNKSKAEYQIDLPALPSPGESVGVTVTHIQDAHNLYVSLDLPLLNTLMIRIQERMKGDGSSLQPPSQPQDLVGAFCLARYSRDNVWYRGVILNARYNAAFEPQYHVHFVDFGNSEERELRHIKAIIPEECKARAQCCKCSLYAVLPKEHSWSNECNIRLQELLDSKTANMTVARIIDEEILEVALVVSGVRVNEDLVSRGLARRKNLEPPRLDPPDEDFPLVYVSYFERTTAVVVRYLGDQYSEALEELEERMLDAYGSTAYNADEFVINIGGVYAALNSEDDGGMSACRVKVLRCRETRLGRQADCYLPDHGDTETVQVSKLRWLRDEFRQLPYQAVTFNLRGLEQFESDQNILRLMVQDMLGMEFAAEFDPEDPTGKSVMLHDPDTNQNMNEWLLQQLPDSALIQRLPEPNATYGGDVIAVKVLNIRDDGVIGVRIPGEGERRYAILEKDLQENMNSQRYDRIPAECLVRGAPVVAQYVEDGGDVSWYRAEILKISLDDVLVEFVDYGNMSTVSKNQVFAFKQMDLRRKLESLPKQRQDVRLSGIPPPGGEWTSQALDALGSVLDPDGKFQLRVDTYNDSGPADVSIFGYTEDAELASINDYLLQAENLFQNEKKEEERRVQVAAASRAPERQVVIGAQPNQTQQRQVSLGPQPVLPNLESLTITRTVAVPPATVQIVDQGQFMTVYVPWADDYLNFACIPTSCFQQLSDLLDRMFSHYSRTPHVAAELVRGQMYAGLYENLYYRVVATNLFHDKRKVSAYLLDFGEYRVLDYSDLQPLDSSFQTIPKMSFKAKLGGLAPEKGGFTVELSRLFQSMVVGRKLHCLILDKTSIEAGQVLVDLVCTNTSEDICISTSLIEAGLARPEAV